MAFMINSEGYCAGTGRFPALPLNTEAVGESLKQTNIDLKFCEKIEGETHINPDGTIRDDVGLGFCYGIKH